MSFLSMLWISLLFGVSGFILLLLIRSIFILFQQYDGEYLNGSAKGVYFYARIGNLEASKVHYIPKKYGVKLEKGQILFKKRFSFKVKINDQAENLFFAELKLSMATGIAVFFMLFIIFLIRT